MRRKSAVQNRLLSDVFRARLRVSAARFSSRSVTNVATRRHNSPFASSKRVASDHPTVPLPAPAVSIHCFLRSADLSCNYNA